MAQWYGWDVAGLCLFVPIGNAGNVTAIMSGFLKMLDLGIITSLPRVFGVQSEHADPVWRYYAAPKETRHWQPVTVTPSVAQAAMIGNPVSFPRVRRLAECFVEAGGETAFQVVQVTEQQIMDAMIQANRHGHIACTQGGECLAGLLNARALGLIGGDEHAVLDATAHSLKFAGFQDMYFNDAFPPEYGVTPDKSLANRPELLLPESARQGRDVAEIRPPGRRGRGGTVGFEEEIGATGWMHCGAEKVFNGLSAPVFWALPTVIPFSAAHRMGRVFHQPADVVDRDARRLLNRFGKSREIRAFQQQGVQGLRPRERLLPCRRFPVPGGPGQKSCRLFFQRWFPRNSGCSSMALNAHRVPVRGAGREKLRRERRGAGREHADDRGFRRAAGAAAATARGLRAVPAP